MRKPRVVVTCPQTGVTVITRIDYDDIAGPAQKRLYFSCPCGETHKLIFAGRHADLGKSPPPSLDNNRAS